MNDARGEWGAMARAFSGLLEVFDHEVPERVLRAVSEVVDIAEHVDRVLDHKACAAWRAEVRQDIARGLSGKSMTRTALGRDIARYVSLTGDNARLLACVDESDRMLRATSRAAFVRGVRAEGRAFSAIFVPLFEAHTSTRFIRYFLDLGEAANLVDKLVDARADFARGELPFRPTLGHHARLLMPLARMSLDLGLRAPHRLRLVRWAAWFFLPSNHESARVVTEA